MGGKQLVPDSLQKRHTDIKNRKYKIEKKKTKKTKESDY